MFSKTEPTVSKGSLVKGGTLPKGYKIIQGEPGDLLPRHRAYILRGVTDLAGEFSATIDYVNALLRGVICKQNSASPAGGGTLALTALWIDNLSLPMIAPGTITNGVLYTGATGDIVGSTSVTQLACPLQIDITGANATWEFNLLLIERLLA
ncbi:MAG: hypothetical protein U1A27_00105 [Phycisphaerae bacterium]